MNAVLITYDLNKPGQSYDKLYEKIKGVGSAWWHYLDSTWIVASAKSPSQVFEAIRLALDDSDSVLILNITGDTYSGWLTQDAWNWIKQHV